MDNTEKAELAEGIATVIQKHGHTVGTVYKEGEGYCLLGAGRYIQNADLYDGRFIEEDFRTAEALGFSHPSSVVRYNDPLDLELGKMGGIDQKQAYEVAMDAAKHWRNEG